MTEKKQIFNIKNMKTNEKHVPIENYDDLRCAGRNVEKQNVIYYN
jgi:hypothetical protein